MTKQMGRNRSFCRAVARRHREGGRRRHGMRPRGRSARVSTSVISATSSQVPNFEADAAARLTPDYWTVFNLEKAAEAGSALAEAQARPSPSWLASWRRAIRSIAVMKADFRRSESSPSPTPSIGRPARDLPASRPFRRYCSIRRARKVKPTPNLETLAPRRRSAGQEWTARHRDQCAGHDLHRHARRACRGGRDADRTGPRPDRDDPIARRRGPARTARCRLSHRSVASRRGEAFCFGGGLYIDPVFPDYQVKAIVAAEPTASVQRCETSSCQPLPRSTTTA